MGAPEPRHLFAVPDSPTWFDVAVMGAASRLARTPDSLLSPAGRELKRRMDGWIQDLT